MKILLECHHAIGDVVMTFPALHNLRELYPQAQIDYLGGLQAEIPLIMNTGNVEQCFIYDVKKNNMPDLFKLAMRLRKEHYDLGIAMGQSPRGLDVALLKLSGCKEIVAMKNLNAVFKKYRQVDVSMHKHRVLQHVELIKALGGSAEVVSETIDVGGAAVEKVFKENNITAQDKVIGIIPGTGDFFYRDGKRKVLYNTKKWSFEKFAALADRLVYTGYTVLLLGGNKERTDVAASGVTFNEKCVNLLGALELLTTISVMTKCEAVVGADTGPMHCAAAAGVPTVTLFGPTDSEIIGPFGADSKCIYGETECRKCFSEDVTKGYDCVPSRCMESISVDRVYEVIMDTIK